MWNEDVDRVVQQLFGEVMLEVKDWRLQNPKATFREIEAAVDGSWALALARPDAIGVARASEATEVSSDPEGKVYQCPRCSHPLESRGRRTRNLITNYNQSIT